MIPGFATAKRRVRSLGGKVLRRVGLLPGGVPDRLGDDKEWRGRSFQGDVVVFFPDTRGGLYQLRTWYGPFEALHRARGLTIVCMDSRTAETIRGETDLPVMTISQESFLDELIQRSNIKLFLYVNFTQANFLALRIRSVIHIALTHGDSDKSVSVSNQVKAFDFSFVAGQAAIDRFERYTALFDAKSRCVTVGRPQIDTDPQPVITEKRGEARATVLYAPTWEGGHETVSYGSVLSHGLPLVRSLVDAGFRVLYRPHPLTGQRLAAHGEADNEIRRFLISKPGHAISVSRSISEDFAEADLLISDVSSVANDWLVTGKPIIITRSSASQTREAATDLLQLVPRLPAVAAGDSGMLVREQIEEDPIRERRIALTEYYLGDTTPGTSLKRFLDACEAMAELRDREWARISASEGVETS